jgi:hypothetical protein
MTEPTSVKTSDVMTMAFVGYVMKKENCTKAMAIKVVSAMCVSIEEHFNVRAAEVK